MTLSAPTSITAATRIDLAVLLAGYGAINPLSVDYCAHCMTYAPTTMFGSATITKQADGWKAVINQNF